MMRTPIEPPRFAERMLGRILSEDPAGTTILGDLHEDFARMHRERGLKTARRWYWGQALALAVPRVLRRAFAVRALRDEFIHATRSVRRNPGFTVFTAALMALGVGAATAIYSVLKPLILAPLPFDDPQQLIWISNDAEDGDNSLASMTSRTANLHDFRGMLAHSVAERRGEISVRMALGASSNEIARDILAHTLRLTCAGMAIGAVLALATTRLLASLLFGVGPADPITFGAMTVVLLVVAGIAGALPAARAVRVSVLEAIRSE